MSVCSAYSQDFNSDEMIIKSAADKTAQINDYISVMASKKKSTEIRKYYKTKALRLFLGDGYHYVEDGKEREGVLIEITSSLRKHVSQTLTRIYFDELIRLRFTNIIITSTEVANIKVSNLYQIDDSLYACT